MLMIRESVAASLLKLDGVYDCICHALVQQAAGQVEQSEPRSLFLKAEVHNNRYHVKGAYLANDLVAGFRIREFTHVPAHSDEMQLILLSHLETAAFLGLVSGDKISERRYGATVAVCIETLWTTSATTLAVVGAGNLARAAVEAIDAATPFETIRVASRSPESRQQLCNDMTELGITGLVPADNIEAACDGADVILTITNTEGELIRADWCQPGMLVVSTGGRRECEPDVVLKADKVFIDDWDQCTLLGDIAALHGEGRVIREDVTATLGDLVTGAHPGRESDEERIVAIPQGLTSLDVALAHFVYREAMEKNLGTEVEWP